MILKNSSSTGYESNKDQIITWNQHLGLKECPYMIRWIFNFYFFSIRIHHWLKSDDKRYYHDHPWWFWTLVLKGAYIDDSEEGLDFLGQGSVRYRNALHKHTVVVPEGADCWTLVITGKYKRPWGFWRDGKFIQAKRYFFQYGHHPCTDGDDPIKTDDRYEKQH